MIDIVSHRTRFFRQGGGREDAQPLAVVAWLRRDVERDPPVGTVERDRAHFLQVPGARACAHGERRGRVGVVELVAEVDAEFLLLLLRMIERLRVCVSLFLLA